VSRDAYPENMKTNKKKGDAMKSAKKYRYASIISTGSSLGISKYAE